MLRLGTRGSALALAQTGLVETALRAHHAGIEISSRVFTTSGDKSSEGRPVEAGPAGIKGLFTKELEEALQSGKIDVAVHSLKDLPGCLAPSVCISAVLPRASVEDVLISKTKGGMDGLREGAIIGTGSLRRKMQLLRIRPDLRVVETRGNVPTRLRKLRDSSDLSALVLAKAGLDRLGYESIGQRMECEGGVFHLAALEQMLPAIGQGAIALQTRVEDVKTRALLEPVNDRSTFFCIRAEREFLRLLNGDCSLPVGARVTRGAESLSMEAIVFDPLGVAAPLTGRVSGAGDDPEGLANALFKKLYGSEI